MSTLVPSRHYHFSCETFWGVVALDFSGVDLTLLRIDPLRLPVRMDQDARSASLRGAACSR
jgi:hypothetical protein